MAGRSPQPTSAKQLTGPVIDRGWANVGDFWNDPRRWDGVDPHKECFWAVRRPDVIDVRPMKRGDVTKQQDRALNVAALMPYGIANIDDLMSSWPGSIIRYTPH